MAQKQYKNNIFDVLQAIDRSDYGYYSTLSDEQRKEINPWLTMRWLSAVESRYAAHYLLLTNEIVNVDLSELSSHPELIWKLMCVCGSGQKQKHLFIKPPKRRVDQNSEGLLSEMFPWCDDKDLSVLSSINTREDIINKAADLGISEEEISGKTK